MNTDFHSAALTQDPPAPIVLRVRSTVKVSDATQSSPIDLPLYDLGTAAWNVEANLDLNLMQPRTSWSFSTTFLRQTTGEFIAQAFPTSGGIQQTGEQLAYFWVPVGIEAPAHSVQDFLRAIQRVLTVGAFAEARDIAIQGSQRYPSDPDIIKYARVLAPPRVIHKEVNKKNDLRLNRDWLMKHGDAFRGKWVALRDGELIATADSMKQVMEKLGANKNTFVTKVF